MPAMKDERAEVVTGGPEHPESALPPLDFSTFLLSLASSAMVNLGKVPAPGVTGVRQDLPSAKQIIDILGILEEKTRGNLEQAEERLLQSLLYDLRVHYCDATAAAAKK